MDAEPRYVLTTPPNTNLKWAALESSFFSRRRRISMEDQIDPASCMRIPPDTNVGRPKTVKSGCPTSDQTLFRNAIVGPFPSHYAFRLSRNAKRRGNPSFPATWEKESAREGVTVFSINSSKTNPLSRATL